MTVMHTETSLEYVATFADRVEQLVNLAVVDSAGQTWAPVWGYDGQIGWYAPWEEAINMLNAEYEGYARVWSLEPPRRDIKHAVVVDHQI
jgi:hypothetical protein